MSKGYFEYVGHGITWIPQKQPTIKMKSSKQLIIKDLKQEIKYYKNLTKTLQTQLEYYTYN